MLHCDNDVNSIEGAYDEIFIADADTTIEDEDHMPEDFVSAIAICMIKVNFLAIVNMNNY